MFLISIPIPLPKKAAQIKYTANVIILGENQDFSDK
jgi:hypothetical protein